MAAAAADTVQVTKRKKFWHDFFWIDWLTKADETKYGDKTNIIHTYYIWLCIKNDYKTLTKNDFRRWVRKYSKFGERQQMIDDLTEEQFIKLVFAQWKPIKGFHPLLIDLGLANRFIEFSKQNGYYANWQPS